MARFRGIIRGTRGKATRLGHRKGGLTTECNGWKLGVRVDARVDAEDQDVFDVHVTGGSNREFATQVLAVKPNATRPNGFEFQVT